MKAKVIEIAWHCKNEVEPIHSIQHHPELPRILTAGSDSTCKVWEYKPSPDGFFEFEFISCLHSTDTPINVARWASVHDMIVTASDGGAVIIWKRAPAGYERSEMERTHEHMQLNKEEWLVYQTLACPKDVYALAISPTSQYLLTGCENGSTSLWDFVTGHEKERFEKGHKEWVQGAAWDPLDVFVASQGQGRVMFAYCDLHKCAKMNHSTKKGITEQRLTKAEFWQVLPAIEKDKFTRERLFKEKVHCYFRRPSWSPDGLFLVAAAGQMEVAPALADGGAPQPAAAAEGVAEGGESEKEDRESEGEKRAEAGEGEKKEQPQKEKDKTQLNCAQVFIRGNFPAPFLSLPIQDEHPHTTFPSNVDECVVLGSAWSPCFYKPRPGVTQGKKWNIREYRMILVVWTPSRLYFFDTSESAPFAIIKGLHVACIFEATWALDGQSLMVASMDGYVSVVRFDPGDLGETFDLSAADPRAEALPPSLEKLLSVRQNLQETRSTVAQKLDEKMGKKAAGVNKLAVVSSRKRKRPSEGAATPSPAEAPAAKQPNQNQ